MSLAGVFNLDVNDERTMLQFALDNMDQHRQIQEAVFRQFGSVLPLFPLDPIPANDFNTWALNHQSMHSAVNDLLGLPDFDLTAVDITKPEQVIVWAELHGRGHQMIAQALGI